MSGERNPRNDDPSDDVSPPLPVIPSELISEILLRLPVRSLLRFRCVCKKWKSAISDTHFARLHLYRSTMDPTLNHHRLLLLNHTTSQPRLLSCSVNSLFNNTFTPFENHNLNLRPCYYRYHLILGTCNGVVCLYDPRTMHLRLCNPSTRLTSRRVYPFKGHTLGRILFYHGFGYDDVSEKFKAVLVFRDPSPQDFHRTVTRVYAFGDSRWKTIQNFNFLGYPTNRLGVFVSGTLNWVALAKGTGAGGSCHVIHSFDLGKDTFGEVSLPDFGHGNPVYPVHASLKNCLSVCYDSKRTHCVVWLMKEYGVKESWTKFMAIPYMELQVSRFFPDIIQPLCMSENGRVLLNLMSSYVRPVVYNPKDGRLEYPLIQSSMVCCSQHVYLESLVSPCF